MRSLITSLFATLAVAACAAGPASAQSADRPNVMVLADDEDIDSVPMSNDIHYRTMAELRSKMTTYRVLDTDAVLARLDGWALPDRLTRAEKIRFAQAACSEGDSTTCPRVLVFVKARASLDSTRYGSKASVRLQGDVVDIKNNTTLGNWQPVSKSFNAPAECGDYCRDETIGKRAYDIASDLGEVLKIKLDSALKVRDSRTPRRAESDAVVWTDYLITLRGFSRQDIFGVLDVMEKVWDKGQGKVGDCSECTSAVWRQNYSSRLTNTQLQRVLTSLMFDMGLEEQDFRITTSSGREIVVEKIIQ